MFTLLFLFGQATEMAATWDICFVCLLFGGLGQAVTVVTDIGNITGEVENVSFNNSQYSLITFLGIPYAEPPTGDRRFHKPIRKLPFREPFMARTMPPICLQNGIILKSIGFEAFPEEDEDCLYLNIFVPGTQIEIRTLRAVMIWIYGGGFQTGFQDLYGGKAFAAMNDVLLVTFNYRVSALGFLSTAENNLSGNYGLWDQHMAIQWVHDHIFYFGGDINRVTLFGESAGSASVVYQALYEGNLGLFQRVIAQSGSANIVGAFDTNPGKRYREFANMTGCWNESQTAIIRCLRNIPATDLKPLLSSVDKTYNPVVDGDFVKANPVNVFLNKTTAGSNMLRNFGKYDFIFGLNSAEGGLILPTFEMIVNKSGVHIPSGYNMALFESMAIPFGLRALKIRDTNVLRQAILQEYVQWNNPSDSSLMLQKTIDMFSDALFNAGVIKAALSHSDVVAKGRLYFYVFDQKGVMSDQRYTGANHGDDIAYVLGFPQGVLSLYMKNYSGDPATVVLPEDLNLSVKLMKYWTNFAKTGY